MAFVVSGWKWSAGNERSEFVSCLFVVGYGSKLLTVFDLF